MKSVSLVIIGILSATTAFLASASEPTNPLMEKGAFGFPQTEASVVCDTGDLRVSVWNDASHLFVQAILWKDDNSEQGLLDDGRATGDSSVLSLDIDADRKRTEELDRYYHLNPWPEKPGLWYQVVLSEVASTTLKGDSRGRGSIQYVETHARRVRVDSFVIPLDEIGLKPGDSVRFAYIGESIKPQFTVNSIGYRKTGEYYFSDLPWRKFHHYKLEPRTRALDVNQFPRGRD